MSRACHGFIVYFLIPARLLIVAIRIFEARNRPGTGQMEFVRIAIWLAFVPVILTAHHNRAGQWRETADRVADKIIEYSALEGHCPASIDRWNRLTTLKLFTLYMLVTTPTRG